MVRCIFITSQVKASEDEVMTILERRKEEEATPELIVSVYDVARNQEAFQQREEEEQAAQEEERLQKEKEKDYLSPFLARLIGHSSRLDQDQMKDVTEVGDMVDVGDMYYVLCLMRVMCNFLRNALKTRDRVLWRKPKSSRPGSMLRQRHCPASRPGTKPTRAPSPGTVRLTTLHTAMKLYSEYTYWNKGLICESPL